MSATTEAARPTALWQRDETPRLIGYAGIGLGVLAFWVALPPLHQRSIVLPVLLGVAALALGIVAIVRGERRAGWGAIASGIVGIAGGVLATHSGVTHLETVVVWSALLSATLRSATPLTFAAIGGLFSERSGVVNIGLEGMMLTGAFFAVWGADITGSWITGLLIAMIAGGLLALIYAFFAIHLRADQIVGGTAINFLALGITGYLFLQHYGDNGTPEGLPQVPDVSLPIDWIPFFGSALDKLNLLVWVALVLVFAVWLFVFRTPAGLRLRSVGENPRAAATVGISVYKVRYLAVIASGVLAAMGGAFLSIGF
ncbi:MAG: ral nucleoside transport system permease protein, partial [Gaiellaceae bacterium]|nr:ral nucleoside transport system permease protein [Gaiellaceae bacterium]